MIDEVLAFMGDETSMRAVIGPAVTANLKEEGHLAHWQRERACYETHRSRIEANLLETPGSV
jgi:hypothetical protein